MSTQSVAHHVHCELVKFHPKQQRELLPSLIRCYQRVFADTPWEEWLHCKKCGIVYGSKAAEQLQIRNFMCCDSPLSEFWPTSKVGQDLNRELIEEASCWLAVHNGIVIGFCWGYPITPEKLEIKIELSGVAATIRESFGNPDKIAYQDELGVLPEYRGQGIAKQLFMKRHADFRNVGLSVGVVRTKQSPPSVTYSWFTDKLSYGVIASYEKSDGRVILANDITNLF